MISLVTAVITTHNRQDLLVRAVKSVLSQTYKNLELIVVDDASDERADELLKEFNLKYIYIPKEESKGGNHARNTGILAAKGEYIAFLDDDDYWLPMKIEEQMAVMEEKQCELVYCPFTQEIVNGKDITYIHMSPEPYKSGDMSKKILYTICTNTSCILVKRSALIQIGMFNESLRFWQEYELTIRLAQRGPFYYAWKDLVVYRIDKNDTKRLTNKFYEWQDTVKQIHKIHHSLYETLGFTQKILVKKLIWEDSERRCRNCGLLWKARYYHILTKIVDNSILFKKRILQFIN